MVYHITDSDYTRVEKPEKTSPFNVPSMVFFSSSKVALKRLASSFDMPVRVSSFSKALLALRTCHPKVMYIQPRLRVSRIKLGPDLNRASKISETSLNLSLRQTEKREEG